MAQDSYDKRFPQGGVVPPAEFAAVDGFTAIDRIRAGEWPPAPYAATTRIRMVEVEPGRVVFEGDPRPDYLNPFGSIHGGWTAGILDSAVACAIHSTLKAGQGSTTLELKVNFVRPVLPESAPVRAEGKVVHVGGRIATAEGRLTDAEGRLLAHATTTCFIFEAKPGAR